MIPMGLTDRQAQTLSVIVRLMAERRRAPSVREIMVAAGISSPSIVHHILCGLKARGYVYWLPGKNRSLVLLPRAAGTFVLPPDVAAALDRFCGATGDDPAAIIAEAVALHLGQRAAP